MYSVFTTSLTGKIESAVASTFDCHEVKLTPSLGTTDPIESCYVLVLWYNKSMAITSWSSVPITGKWGKIIFFVFLLRLQQASSLSKMDVQWNMESPTIRRIHWWKNRVQIGSEIGCFEINYMVFYTLWSRLQVNPLTAMKSLNRCHGCSIKHRHCWCYRSCMCTGSDGYFYQLCSINIVSWFFKRCHMKRLVCLCCDGSSSFGPS